MPYIAIGAFLIPLGLIIAFIVLGMFIIATIIVTLVVTISSSVTYKKNLKQFVKDNSEALKKVREINERFECIYLTPLQFSHSYDNPDFYNEVSPEDYLIYQINEDKRNMLSLLNSIKTNVDIYERYTNTIESSHIVYGHFGNKEYKYKKEKLIEEEKKLVRYAIKSRPSAIAARVFLHRVDSHGNVFESKRGLFSYDEVEELLQRISNKSGRFYNDSEIWKSLCRVERARVSNEIRFKIYERDHYRCKRCGATSNLTIDHIVPISKGGKSEPSNLQTLCESCNKAKGNNFYN